MQHRIERDTNLEEEKVRHDNGVSKRNNNCFTSDSIPRYYNDRNEARNDVYCSTIDLFKMMVANNTEVDQMKYYVSQL